MRPVAPKIAKMYDIRNHLPRTKIYHESLQSFKLGLKMKVIDSYM